MSENDPRRHVEIEWTRSASDSLQEIGSRTIRQKVANKIEDLAVSGVPELLGKPLVDELQGLYRISFGRYRIVYRVIRDPHHPALSRIIIRVILASIRKHGDKRDVYERLRRLIARGDL